MCSPGLRSNMNGLRSMMMTIDIRLCEKQQTSELVQL